MPHHPPPGLISDEVISLPSEDLESSCGLAIDIGSTIGKIIYRSKKEYENGQPLKSQDDTNKGQVHFAMFPREDLQGMIKYIEEYCDLQSDEAGQIVVNCSGLGGAAFRSDIETGLNCKLNIISEMDCFCNAFLALEKVMSKDEMIMLPSAQALADADDLTTNLGSVMEKVRSMGETKFSTFLEEDKMKDEDRPRLLVMGGSAMVIMQINKDGTSSVLSCSYAAGRFMYGLSSVLTGENDFTKLIEMAEMSDGRSVDIWSLDLLGHAESKDPDNMYEMRMQGYDAHMFPFGKGVTATEDEIKKGDLVWSVLNTTAIVSVQLILAYVKLTRAKDVYLCGNIFNTELMRNMMLKKKEYINLVMPINQEHQYHFLKNGGMFGALGAYLYKKQAQNTKE